MSADLAKTSLDVGLVANDAQAALAFWRDLLGFSELEDITFPGMTIKRLSLGLSTLRICIPDIPAPALAHEGRFDAQTGLRYITLQVNNLDDIVTAAEAAGYPIPTPPLMIGPGRKAAQITDGAGATVELLQITEVQ